jgi:ATP-dependent Clp protease ATP-binding subunit ClpA
MEERMSRPLEAITAESHKILELAYREALSMGRSEITPMHILHAILRQDGLAARFLVSEGITPSALSEFQRIAELLGVEEL